MSKKALLIISIIIAVIYVLSLRKKPENISYGISFSKFHSDELGLDWKETYLALLNDLGVKNLRLSAHWPMIEPEDDKFNFSEIDFQMQEAAKKNISVILAVGRRLPGWPECHVPGWVQAKSEKEKNKNNKQDFNKEELLEYIEKVVERYKNYPNLKYWQVENEPFLTRFARSHCGPLDKQFLQDEIDLVRRLDSLRKIMITDSGEFGDWFRSYKKGDIFGTSMYLYIWSQSFGPLRYPITPAFFRIKQNLVELFLKDKPSVVIELSSEPWLLQPIINTPLDIQFKRMGIDKFNEMINFSSKTGFDTIYFWGAEWWYWLKKQGYEDHWKRAGQLF